MKKIAKKKTWNNSKENFFGIAAIVKQAFPPKKNIAKIDVNTNLGGGGGTKLSFPHPVWLGLNTKHLIL